MGPRAVPRAQSGWRCPGSHSAGLNFQALGRRVDVPRPQASRPAPHVGLGSLEGLFSGPSSPLPRALSFGATRRLGKCAQLRPPSAAPGARPGPGVPTAPSPPPAPAPRRTHRLGQQEAAFERAEEGARRQEGAEPGHRCAGRGAAGARRGRVGVRVGLLVWGPHGGGGRDRGAAPLPHPAPGREAETRAVRKEKKARHGSGGASPRRPAPAPPLLPGPLLPSSQSPAPQLPRSLLPLSFLLLPPPPVLASDPGCPSCSGPRWAGLSAGLAWGPHTPPRTLPSAPARHSETFFLLPLNAPSGLPVFSACPEGLYTLAASSSFLPGSLRVSGTQESRRPKDKTPVSSSCAFDLAVSSRPHSLFLPWPPLPSLGNPTSSTGCPSLPSAPSPHSYPGDSQMEPGPQ